jgi:hypothetical protein
MVRHRVVVNTYGRVGPRDEKGTSAAARAAAASTSADAGAGPRGPGPDPPSASARVGARPLRGAPPSGDILKGGCAGGRAGKKAAW